MLHFKEFLVEVNVNTIKKDGGYKPVTSADNISHVNQFKKEKHSSITGEHHIYSRYDASGFHPEIYPGLSYASHLWVHKKTGRIDFQTYSRVQKHPTGESTYSKIGASGSGKYEGGIAHHAYYDLMRGATKSGPVIMNHDDMSKGAIKISQKMRKVYPQVKEHGFSQRKNKPYHQAKYSSQDAKSITKKGGPSISRNLDISGHTLVKHLPAKYRIKK